MSATNRGALRVASDLYETPEWCTQAAMKSIDWRRVRNVCEPCVGNGAIWKLLPPVEHATWFEIQRGRDYLTGQPEAVDLVLTNPPYTLAQEFIEQALSHAQTVVMLLRINFLGSQKRRPFWVVYRPTHLLTLSTRPSFTGGGTDATDYAWFCWDRGGFILGPTFQWLERETPQ